MKLFSLRRVGAAAIFIDMARLPALVNLPRA